ncbi:MAG: hypothetical protein ACEPOW_14025 [Bacteroidales bacterium]
MIKDIQDRTPIFCPFCDHTSEHRSNPESANAFVNVNDAGSHYLYCSSENTIYWESSNRQPGVYSKEDGAYYKSIKQGDNWREVKISSFEIIPKELLVLEDSDCLVCDIKTEKGTVYNDFTIENKDWLNKSKLLTAVWPSDCVFTGSDTDVQSTCRFVLNQNPLNKKGTKVIGLHNDIWAIKNKNLTKSGTTENLLIPYEKGKDSLHNRIEYPELCNDEYENLNKTFLKNILKINDINTILPWVSWMLTTPVKPIIRKKLKGFPHLFTHGGQGGGKSSTGALFNRLFGHNNDENFSCTMKEFPMLKLLSSTNAVPLIFDEFKKSDMSEVAINNLHRYMRKTYSGEVESKGLQNQTLVNYYLTAPMVVMGEWNITQPAIRERLLVSSFSNVVKTDLKMQEAFEVISQLPLESFMNKYIPFLLNQDVDYLLKLSKNKIKELFIDMKVPPRIKNNLTVYYMGFVLFRSYAKNNKIEIENIDIDSVLKKQLEEITGSNNGEVLSAVDQLLQGLSVMHQSESNKILLHQDYKMARVDGKSVLAINIKALLPRFNEWAKRTHYEVDILDYSSYLKMFDDTDYVVKKNHPVNISQNLARCLCIDIEKIKEKELELEVFEELITGSYI